MSLFCYDLLSVVFSFASMCLGRESWLLLFDCLLDVMLLLLLLPLSRSAVGWSVVCDCVIPGHTHYKRKTLFNIFSFISRWPFIIYFTKITKSTWKSFSYVNIPID